MRPDPDRSTGCSGGSTAFERSRRLPSDQPGTTWLLRSGTQAQVAQAGSTQLVS